jgi:hypothetical protein
MHCQTSWIYLLLAHWAVREKLMLFWHVPLVFETVPYLGLPELQ